MKPVNVCSVSAQSSSNAEQGDPCVCYQSCTQALGLQTETGRLQALTRKLSADEQTDKPRNNVTQAAEPRLDIVPENGGQQTKERGVRGSLLSMRQSV